MEMSTETADMVDTMVTDIAETLIDWDVESVNVTGGTAHDDDGKKHINITVTIYPLPCHGWVF